MEVLKLDRTKLKRVKNYADESGYSVQHVYRLAKSKQIRLVEIDGVKFIHI